MSARAFKPTEEQRRAVKTMAGFGIPQNAIAAAVGCHPETLRKRFRHELDLGTTEANMKVAETLFHLATVEKNVTACIFWLKTRAGWREADRSGDAAEPMCVVITGGLPDLDCEAARC